ncbi:FAD-dependent oxidoreductase [Agromyces laixinhei]|uniref:FAD-dependent oxidoreductase n=1 Tax=Agromyces laixinhei TaxID=2585717 RepID=UPI0012EE773B|nr:NAD(P)/FAD-dependent oxidoreductase [Agromyces laixinhei]
MVERRAEIAGAGIAGLVAASALAQRGWSVTVHERSPELRTYGAAISAWPNFTAVLSSIGALPEVLEHSFALKLRETRDARDRVVYRVRIPDGEERNHFSVKRQPLINALVATARRHGVVIRTGSHAVSADPEGILHFADGSSVQADLIVGADGVNSKVRDSLGVHVKRPTATEGAVRMIIPSVGLNLPGEVGTSIEYWSGRRRLFVSKTSDDDVFLAFMASPKDKRATQVPLDKESWSESFPRSRDLIARADGDARWDNFETITVTPWFKGRVALVGDAANAMPPHIGQGAALGACNALALAEHVSRHENVALGLAEWDRTERGLTDHSQRVSWWYGKLNGLPSALREAGLKLAGRSKWVIGLRQRPALHVPTGVDSDQIKSG